MGSAASAPPPPDTSKYSDQAWNLSESMQRMGQSMYEWGQTQQNMLSEGLSSFMGSAMPVMQDQFNWAKKLQGKFESDVIPQLDSLFKEADTYASKAEEQRQRGVAIQDVNTAMEAQRAAHERKLKGAGADPSVVSNQAMDRTWGVQQGAMQALAANQAGERTKQIGRDLRGQAIDAGQTYLQNANQSNLNAANIGTAGINAANATTQAAVMAGQSALPYLQGAESATQTGAGIVDTAYNQQLAYAEDQRAAEAANAEGLAGIGNMAGTAMSFFPPTAALGTALKTVSSAGAKAAEGGTVMAPGTPTSDSGVLQVSNGEYVVPADVVRKLGTNHFDKMIEKETGRPPPSAKVALPTGGM